MVEDTACACVIFMYGYTLDVWVIIGGKVWKHHHNVLSYTVVDYLTGNLHDLLSLPQIVGQYFADELS